MAEQHEIKTLADILKLDDAQFVRFVPDFVAWRNASRLYLNLLSEKWEANQVPADFPEHEASILWTDDGNQGVITDIQISAGDEVLLLSKRATQAAKQGEQP